MQHLRWPIHTKCLTVQKMMKLKIEVFLSSFLLAVQISHTPQLLTSCYVLHSFVALSKSVKILLSKSIFYVKNHPNVLIFFQWKIMIYFYILSNYVAQIWMQKKSCQEGLKNTAETNGREAFDSVSSPFMVLFSARY